MNLSSKRIIGIFGGDLVRHLNFLVGGHAMRNEDVKFAAARKDLWGKTFTNGSQPDAETKSLKAAHFPQLVAFVL